MGERHLRRREREAAMTIRRRTGFILVGIACALLVVLIFLLPILLNADRYRTKVVSYLEEKTGKNVEIGRLAVTFSPGLAIQVDDFGVKSPPLFPPSYIVKVARIDAQLDAINPVSKKKHARISTASSRTLLGFSSLRIVLLDLHMRFARASRRTSYFEKM